jgi:5-methylcytosine-specific restriction endonuclease McrA
MQVKKCSKCGKEKSHSDFYKNKSTSDGFHGQCKLCMSANKKLWLKKYPEKNRAQSKKWASENAEKQREVRRKATAKYHKVHKGEPEYEQKQSKYSSVSRVRRAEYNKSYMENWSKRNRELINQYSRNRRARKRAAEGTISLDVWNRALEFYGNKCLRCFTLENITLDHVIPLSKGGANKIENAQPLCFSCNAKKHTNTTDYRDIIYTESQGEQHDRHYPVFRRPHQDPS